MMMQSAVAACRRMGFGGGLVRRAVAGAGAGVVRPVRAAGECGLVRRQQPLTHVVAAPAIMPVRPGVRPLSALNSGLRQQQHAEQRQGLAFPGARFNSTLSAPDYHKLSDAWLEGMCDTFEDLIDSAANAADYDVTYADGVLTLRLGDNGTYVLNKQTPNKQIWLSSPTTGPKRYDWSEEQQCWVYSHDNIPLHKRLADELGPIFNTTVDVTENIHTN